MIAVAALESCGLTLSKNMGGMIIERSYVYDDIQMATCNKNVRGLFRDVWRVHRAQFLQGLPCVPRSKVSLGEGGQQRSRFRPRGSHSMKETSIVNSLPQVRYVTSVERISWGLTRGAICSPPVQESRLNWWGLEIVK